ncbi:MAG: magnesium transporter [Planctomycetes bacterium]|nr:magnesium transporter [Planctomycetota bacterium]
MPDEQKQLLQQVLLHQIEALLSADDTDKLADLLKEQRSSDIAEIVELVDNEQRRIIFDVLEQSVSAKVLEKVDEATRNELFDLLEDKELNSLISHLNPDDAADVLLELPEEEITEVLDSIPPDESDEIRKLMSYSEDSAGGIMDPVLISVREDATVAEAVNKIRSAEIDEDFFSVYVIDKTGRFVGDVRVRLLLTTSEGALISSLIDPDTIYVTAEADQEEVRNVFSKNDLIVAPVLNKKHKLIGRITADRIIEVAEEEAAEDLYAMAGTDADELDDVSVFRAARIRMTWLLPCLMGTGVTALVMMFFKGHNPVTYVAAVAFVPMIAAISGNAGLQTSAIVVSGLATGHLAALKLSQVFTREVRVALLVALSCGVMGALICTFLPHLFGIGPTTIDLTKHLRIVSAFGIAMFSAIMVATTLGLFLPFLFRRIGIDPAISSGPLVTTANDSISVAIYMTLTLLLVG